MLCINSSVIRMMNVQWPHYRPHFYSNLPRKVTPPNEMKKNIHFLQTKL